MPRKLRMNEAGGLYHILNRGNYRQWIFKEERTKEVFERTLFEACDRAGWVLHGYCIMSNHYHLALETTEGNLSERPENGARKWGQCFTLAVRST